MKPRKFIWTINSKLNHTVKCGKKYMPLVIPKKSFVYITNYTYGANDRKIQSDSKIPKPSNVTGYAPQLYAWFLDMQNPYDSGRSIKWYSRRSLSSWNLMHAKYERATGAWLTAWLSRVGIWCVKFSTLIEFAAERTGFPSKCLLLISSKLCMNIQFLE